MPSDDAGTSLTLLGRLRTADADAWVRLVALYGPLVAYWVRRGGVTGADAEDLVQEVFREVSQALPAFRRDGRPAAGRGGGRDRHQFGRCLAGEEPGAAAAEGGGRRFNRVDRPLTLPAHRR